MYPVAPVTRINSAIYVRQYTCPRRDLSRQPIENEFMDGPHRVPVKKSKQAIRRKIGCDRKQCFSILWCCLELQPGIAGQFHFGAQTQKMVWLHLFDTP